MSFAGGAARVPVTVEMQIGGVWTNITSKVRTEEGITIRRGRADEASSQEASTCLLTLDNRDGRFSPRNPSGPYYGQIGRNTPLRVSVNLGTVRLVGGPSSNVSAPDSVGLSVTGDLDARAELRMPSWAENRLIMSKYGTAGLRSWRLYTDSVGRPVLQWSNDGTAELLATATVPLRTINGRQAIRATLDVDNGAAGRTVTFYTAPTIAGPWSVLGSPVVQAGTTAIFDSTTSQSLIVFSDWELFAFEIRSGIGGTVVASPTFTSQTVGATSFADAQGNTWTVTGSAAITSKRNRFFGEVSAFPATWDISGSDVEAPIEAAGIRRRLSQGASPLRSAFYRAASGPTLASSLRAYWPAEDAAGSSSISSPMAGVPAMTFTTGVALAEDSESFVTSDPLPVTTGGFAVGYVPAYTSTGEVQVRWLAKPPSTVSGVLMRVIFNGGTVYFADLTATPSGGGTLELLLYGYPATPGATPLVVSTTGVFAVANGIEQAMRYSMEFRQVGGNIEFGYAYLRPGATSGNATTPVSYAGTLGTAAAVVLGPNSDLAGVTFGHVSVQDDVTTIFDLAKVLDAYAEETAGRRIERLSSEESVPFLGGGDLDVSENLGPQLPDTFLNLVDEAAFSDPGLLLERRDALGLFYRPRSSIYGQTAALTVAYAALQELGPVEDDRLIRNDVTAERIGGSSARAVLSTGALSVLAPPSGVGRYEDAVSLSLFTDAQADDQAQFRLMQGTIDEARFPGIKFDLASPAFSSSTALTTAALDVDLGDLLTVTGPPAWMPPDTINQILQGTTEVLLPFSYRFGLNCSPASAWTVGVYDQGSPAMRWAADGSTLNASITSTATGAAALALVTPAGKPLWTSDPADFPMNIRVGGEVITLSAIAATASPQSATVSARSVNGVVKAHSAGAAVQIADPVNYAF